MKTTIRTLFFLNVTFLFSLLSNVEAQNIGINGTGVNAHSSALLDVDAAPANNTGLLIPRIPLQATNLAVPVISPATSLLVYNTATAGSGTVAVFPGYYYWDGTKWVRFQYSNSIAQDWNLLGNAGTNPTTNFLGTTDNQDLVFRTNNLEKMRLTSVGRLGLNINNPIMNVHFAPGPNDDVLNDGTTPWYMLRTTTYPAVAGIAYGGLGFVSENSSLAPTAWPPQASIDFITGEIHTATTKGTGMIFQTTINGTTTLNERMRITPNGNVGIGTTNPLSKLEVQTIGVDNSLTIKRGLTTIFDQLASGQTAFGSVMTPTLGYDFVYNLQGINSTSATPTNDIYYVAASGSKPIRQIYGNDGANFGTFSFINSTIATSKKFAFTINSFADTIMSIVGNGNIGIGTTTPGALLHLNGVIPRLAIYDSDGTANKRRWDLNVDTDEFYIQQMTDAGSGTGDLFSMKANALGTGPADAYFGNRATNSPILVADYLNRRVGVGTANPIAKLNVHGGNLVFSDPILNNSPLDPWLGLTTSVWGLPFMHIGGYTHTDGIRRLGLYADILHLGGITGQVGIGTTTPAFKLDVNGTTACTGNVWTSDRRKKQNIQPLNTNALDIVNKLNPVTYEWKEVKDDGMKGTQMGFIAQELEQVLPTIVVTANNDEQSKGVKYNELLPIIIKAMQELSIENDNLKKQNAEILNLLKER